MSENDQANNNRTILVVDDEAHIVHVVSLKLRNAGFEVIAAVDGEEGLEMARKHHPDLIITDFQMPYLTGLEMCEALQKETDLASIPVIMLTARGFALEEDNLRAVNIVESLSKPFSPRELLGAVNGILSGQDICRTSRET